MSINVEIIEDELIEPLDMLLKKYSECCFQQYHNNIAQKTYYINAGYGEEALICIWYNDEDCSWRLSTDNLKSLKQFVKTVKVKQIKKFSVNFTFES